MCGASVPAYGWGLGYMTLSLFFQHKFPARSQGEVIVLEICIQLANFLNLRLWKRV